MSEHYYYYYSPSSANGLLRALQLMTKNDHCGALSIACLSCSLSATAVVGRGRRFAYAYRFGRTSRYPHAPLLVLVVSASLPLLNRPVRFHCLAFMRYFTSPVSFRVQRSRMRVQPCLSQVKCSTCNTRRLWLLPGTSISCCCLTS